MKIIASCIKSLHWPSDLLPEVAPVEGPPPPVTLVEIHKALSKMKCGKAAGPSGIIAEMIKAGEECIVLLRDLAESVFSNGVIPKDWEENYEGIAKSSWTSAIKSAYFNRHS